MIDRERGWKQRKIREAAHIAMSEKCISQASAEFSHMWLPILRRKREEEKKKKTEGFENIR